MDKPTVLVVRDTKKALIDIINNSGLPMFVLESIMRELHESTVSAANYELEMAEKTYEEKGDEESGS
jgi:hypothetical protein